MQKEALEEKKIKYEPLARCLKGLAHDMRLKILYLLEDGEKTVSEIEQFTGSSQSNVSQHLILMRDKNILVSRKEANQIYYSIKNKKILSVVQDLCEILGRV